jgi:2-polyprenyl-3-methyl-5-hydroxy-6-metoxy-1,4-benzoquinol methylase
MTTAHPTTADQQYLDTRQAFDSVADRYGGTLGNNRLVQQMREMLWRAVASSAPSGGRLLDLGCGVGLDAVHFAGRGFSVTALDWSPAMVAQTAHAVEAARLAERVTVANLGIQQLDQLSGQTFDCIYSDLGALNCVTDLEGMARGCATLIRPGGALVFSVIGRFCPWELAYYTLRGNMQRARIRFAPDQVPVSLNGHTVWTRYYTPREFYRCFAPHFEWRDCRALNLFLPPPYLIGLYERHPKFFRLMDCLEQHLAWISGFNRAGDHFLLVMSRKSD